MSVLEKRIGNWPSLAAIALVALNSISLLAQEQSAATTEDGRRILRDATEHMQKLEMRLYDGGDDVPLVDQPILTYGDSARANKNGTLWAFGKSGRPLAVLELYQGLEANPRWVHAITLTGSRLVQMKTPTPSGAVWLPEKTQIETAAVAGAATPAAREPARLRQMKEIARRFTAHEFWDPDNSRFELRLLVSPVLRYQDADETIHDGTVFVLAHGTNPEVILLIEALGSSLEESRWHYGLARLGSAEMHVELDGKEVWTVGRTPGVVGQKTDPYWLFLSAAREAP